MQWSEERGISRCVVGYSGGEEADPTYQTIKDHTEAVLIEFDPNVRSYEDILKLWAESDSPYYPQKRQYRSAVFYLDEEQKEVAEAFVQNLNDQYTGAGKLYIDVEPATKFYRGEEYHQNFLVKQRSSSYI